MRGNRAHIPLNTSEVAADRRAQRLKTGGRSQEKQQASCARQHEQQLQDVVDVMSEKVASSWSGLTTQEQTPKDVEFTNEKKLRYPAWMIERKGHELLPVYQAAFGGAANQITPPNLYRLTPVGDPGYEPTSYDGDGRFLTEWSLHDGSGGPGALRNDSSLLLG